MIVRTPPVLAMWMLRYLGSGYRGESLEGDLFEEYQHGRTPGWYRRQVFAAIFVAWGRNLRRAVSGTAATAVLRFLTEAAIILGSIAVAGKSRQLCSIQSMLSPTFIISLIALIALAQSVGNYLSLLRSRYSRKQTPIRRLVAAFALSALSAGTLTWAGTSSKASCVGYNCSCERSAASGVSK
jgi:hypothetical protein